MTEIELTATPDAAAEQVPASVTIATPAGNAAGSVIRTQGGMLLVGWTDPRFPGQHRKDWFDPTTGLRWADFDVDPLTNLPLTPAQPDPRLPRIMP